MKAPSPRSSAMPCTCCSARPANSRTMPHRAVACALALDDCRSHSASAGSKKGIALGATRIGVHAGPAIVGNFGGGRFFDYTAYGDTINIAARLEAANKQLGTRICVSAILAAKVEGFPRPAGRRPRAEGQDRGAARLRAAARRAIRRLQRRRAIWRRSPSWRPAIPARWRPSPRMSASTPDDQLASFHLKRLLNGATGTRIVMD